MKKFFSIVLPTKNRSFLIEFAFSSIMNQTFKDYEFILVDNSDNNETGKLFEKYKEKIEAAQYVKTGGLLMADNWQKAVECARGEYIIILEDKQALKYNALEEIYGLIEKYRYPCISSYPDFINDTDGGFSVSIPDQGDTIRLYSSDDIIKSFLSDPSEISQFLFPSGHHSVVSAKIIQKANASPLKSYCHPIAPDITSGFFQLFYSDFVVRLPEAHTVITTSKVSNGMDMLRNKNTSEIVTSEQKHDLFQFVPIKTAFLVNGIFNDYLMMRSRLGGKFEKHELDVAEYFAQCFINIQRGKSFGTTTSKDEIQWEKYFALLNDIEKKETREKVEARSMVAPSRIEENESLLKMGARKLRRMLKGKPSTIGDTIKTVDNLAQYLETSRMNLKKYPIQEWR